MTTEELLKLKTDYSAWFEPGDEMNLSEVADDVTKLVDELLVTRAERDAAEARALKAATELTNTWPRSDLMRLIRDVDDILHGMNPTTMPGAINWGDLGAREVQIVWTQDYTWHYRVIIEEADPVNPALHDAVLAGLTASDWVGIEIETAW